VKTINSPLLVILAALCSFFSAAVLRADVNVSIGTMQPGESVTITYNVAVSSTLSPSVTQISSQGTVSGSNFASVNTDDPETTTANDATVTSIANSAPVVDLNGAAAGNDEAVTFTEQTPQLIAPSGTITDPESNPILSLTATLTARPDGDATESLSLNASATSAATGLTVTPYASGTGVLLISGSASLATYQTILQGVLYNNSSDNPNTTARSVTVVANDTTSSTTRTSTITVQEVNDPPVAVDDVFSSVAEDSGMQVFSFASLLSNDTKPATESGQTLNITAVGNPVGGSVVINGSDVEFTPAANFYGTASFDYTIQDNGTTAGVSDPKTDVGNASFTVTPVADAPGISSATTPEDTQTTSGLSITRNIVDSTEVTHFKITSILNGTLYQNDGTTVINDGDFITYAQGNVGLKFTPAPNLNSSSSSFSFVAQGATSSGGAGLGAGTTASITIGAVADSPGVTSATTTEDTQTTGGLVISKNAADGTEVTHFKITGITGGTLFQNDGTTAIANGDFITVAEGNAGLKFTPSANLYSPVTTFGFNVQSSLAAADGGLGGSPAVASITVNPVADTPSVANATTDEDTQSTGIVINRNAVDGSEVTHFKITGITGGNLYQNDGTTQISNNDFITYAEGHTGLKFTPMLDLNSPGSSFSFTVQASLSAVDAGLGGGTATATITVDAVNDDPVGVADTIFRAAGDDTKVKISTLLANDTDVEGDTLFFTGVASLSTGGATVSTSGDWVYYVHNGSATDSFTYTISDGHGGTATGTVTVNIQDPDTESSTALSIVVDGSGAHLTFDGLPGAIYTIEFKDTIGDPWQIQGTASSSGLGLFHYDDPAGGSARFYRYVYR
jgi:hypothetical protein